MGNTLQQEATLEQAVELGLRPEDFELIREVLGRTPEYTELALFAWTHKGKAGVLNDTEMIRLFFANALDTVTPVNTSQSIVFSIDGLKQPELLKDLAYKLLEFPFIASRSALVQQKSESQDEVLGLCESGNAHYFQADPEVASMIAVADTSRKIVCAGGTPVSAAVTVSVGLQNDPTTVAVLGKTKSGLEKATQKGGASLCSTQIVCGKSMEEQLTRVAMIGTMEDHGNNVSVEFKQKGDLIFIIGESADEVGSSEYLRNGLKVKQSPAPFFDLEKEFAMQHMVTGLIQNELINAVHDVTEGGLFLTLVEMSMPRGLGFDIVTDSEVREDAFLFGEGRGRVVATVNEDQEEAFIEFMMDSGVNFTLLGHVTKGKMMVDDEHFGFIAEAKELYNNTLG